MRMSCILLNASPGLAVFSSGRVCAYLIAALCHDVAHPGTNNEFEVKVKSQLALEYGDTSVLNMHIATMFSTIDDSSIALFRNWWKTAANLRD